MLQNFISTHRTSRAPTQAAFTLIELLAVPAVVPLSGTKRSSKGFTLIELLVVIAIIALLAAIMVPAMTGAIAKGRLAACSSNLKQINLAMVGYEVDTGGLPIAFNRGNPSPGSYEAMWLNSITPYLNMPTWAQGIPLRQSVITCPVQYRLKKQNYTYSESHQINSEQQGITPGMNTSYPISRQYLFRPAKSNPGRWPTSETTIPVFMDGHSQNATAGYRSWRLAFHLGGDADGQLKSFPHDLAANVLFLDGHVEKEGFGEPGSCYEKTFIDWAFFPQYLDGYNAFL